jgi:hypothetical protein
MVILQFKISCGKSIVLSLAKYFSNYCNFFSFQIIEERPGYDLSQFIADMGGSLGFLLGLSVLGFIGLMEKVSLLINNQKN